MAALIGLLLSDLSLAIANPADVAENTSIVENIKTYTLSELRLKTKDNKLIENDTIAKGFFNFEDYFFDVAIYSPSKQLLTIYINQRNGKLTVYREYFLGNISRIKTTIDNDGMQPFPVTRLVLFLKDGSTRMMTNIEIVRRNVFSNRAPLRTFLDEPRAFIYSLSWIEQYRSIRNGQPQYSTTVGDIDKDGKNEVIYTFYPINDSILQTKPTTIVVFEYVNDNYFRIDWDTVMTLGGFNIGHKIVDFDKNGNYEFIVRHKDPVWGNEHGVIECTGERKYKYYRCGFGTPSRLMDFHIMDSVTVNGQTRTEIWTCYEWGSMITGFSRHRYQSRNGTDYGFAPLSVFLKPNLFAYDIAVGDIDRDGRDELVLGDAQWETNFVDYMDTTGIIIPQQGGWELKTIIPGIPIAPGFSFVKDYDNCGYPELTSTGVGNGTGSIGTLKHIGTPGQNLFQVMWWDSANIYAGPNWDIDTGNIDNSFSVLYPTNSTYYHIYKLHLYTYTRSDTYSMNRTSTYYRDSMVLISPVLTDIDNDSKQNILSPGGFNVPVVQGTYPCFYMFEQNGTIGISPVINELYNGFELLQNYPNPFNASTRIRYKLKKGIKTELIIYDVTGRQIALYKNENSKQGEFDILFNGTDLASGVYFYSLVADDKIIETKKMVIIK
ncbi:MAG: T9SS type A sorting domain-containing protein [Ignavibacteria bacterium]|nr:T9SS type A sorting domain-containing protein [Ignavibacteria bacterium]